MFTNKPNFSHLPRENENENYFSSFLLWKLLNFNNDWEYVINVTIKSFKKISVISL